MGLINVEIHLLNIIKINFFYLFLCFFVFFYDRITNNLTNVWWGLTAFLLNTWLFNLLILFFFVSILWPAIFFNLLFLVFICFAFYLFFFNFDCVSFNDFVMPEVLYSGFISTHPIVFYFFSLGALFIFFTKF